MRNIKLLIEYDGTNYAGWQRQQNAFTIQEAVEKAIFNAASEAVEVVGSSRTDAGVHARGYVANFHTQSSIPAERFREALNCKLPKDIVILSSEQVHDDFHARYSSVGKTYSYSILNRLNPPAIGRNYVYHYKNELDIEAMAKAAKFFVGTHDFAAFKNTGSSVKTSVRTITSSEIIFEKDIIKYVVTGDGFLYNMVRIIVGTLLDAGVGKINSDVIMQIIKSKDRTKAGKSAPAQGLCLERVHY